MNGGGSSRVRRMVTLSAVALLLLIAAYVVLALTTATAQFADPALEAAVREAAGRERGTLSTAELERITRLDAPGRGIELLNGIEQLANLERLNLRGNRVADLAPLAALPRLQQLELRDNNITDLRAVNLNALAGLTQLKYLGLRHNRGPAHPESPDDHARLSDISLLAQLTRLERLDLRDNHVSDLEPLAALHRLEGLDLRDNRLQVDDLSALGGLQQLQQLNLRNSGVSGLGGIETLRNLVHLNLHSNPQIKSIAPLAGLPRLQTLILRNVPIGEQLELIETLPTLQRLNIRNCGVTNLRPLARLMQRGALQDDPPRGIYAEVDIRENLVSFSEPDGYALLEPYWDNVARRRPQQLPPPLSREVLISEVMSSNGSTIDDGSGAYPDWIELYNPGHVAVDLSGYYLSDHRDSNTRWQFPDGTAIGAGDYLLLWASGGDGVGPDGRLHTSFRISADGEAAVLTRPDGRSRVDALLIPPLPRDRSWGRRDPRAYPARGADELVTFAVPTPGAANAAAPEYRTLRFSHHSGFHAAAFELHIEPEPAEARDSEPLTIYYTLDGSLPDPRSVDQPAAYSVKNYQSGEQESWYEQTYRYDGPIRIDERPAETARISSIETTSPNADFWQWQPPQHDPLRATVVRAVAYTSSDGPVAVSDVVTATFIVTPEASQRFSLPLVAVATPPSGLFDFERGIYVPGRIYDEAQPYRGNWMAQQANYSQPWERAAHIEFFEPGGSRALALDGGIRIHGSFSRSHPLKSLRLYARKDYDVRNYFEYPIFPYALRRDDRSTPIERYKRLILRSGQSLFRSHLQDALIQQHLMDHVEVDMLRYRPVVHLINGEYWGIKNVRERFDRFYIEANYGIDPDEVIAVDGPFGFDSQLREGRRGDNRPYFELHRFIEEHDMSDPEHYARVLREMDVLSFIDYNIVRIYSSDRDGVDKHIAAWRKRTDFDPHAPRGHDGRWRFYTWDFDNAMLFHHNTIELYANDEDSANGNARQTAMIVNLLRNDEFRTMFINRFASLLNTVMQPAEMRAAIDRAAALLAPEIGEHIQRWGYPTSLDYWQEQVDAHRRFVSERPEFDRDYLEAYFSRRGYPIDGRYTLQIQNRQPAGGYVRVGYVDVRAGTPGIDDPALWSGTWFGDIPLQLQALAAAGYRFSGWQGDLERAVSAVDGIPASASHRIVIRTTEDVHLSAAFEPLE